MRRGKTAERILATQVIELPLECTPEQREKCAQAFVDDWRERGHQAVAVVHVHGEEHEQPHLHVEIAARPVHADGAVDRSARLWAGDRPREAVYDERQTVADIVNRTCDPDPPYHPGGFRDIGIERQPRTRMPAVKFRKARAEIRKARAANDTEREAEIEAAAYTLSDAERGKKRQAREDRSAVVLVFKKAGLPVRMTQRLRLAITEAGLQTERERLAAAEQARKDAAKRARAAEIGRDGANSRVAELKAQLREMNERQTKYITDWHGERGVEPPDLESVEGQSEAWANMRAWEAEARKKAEAKEQAAKAEIEAALEDERARTQGKIDAAVRLALADGQARQKAAERPKAEEPPVTADLPAHEASPVPAAVPAERTAALAPGDLLEAGLAAEMRALAKWGAKPKDASPTARALEGIAGSPVLMFTPAEGGTWKKKRQAQWRYEDEGRYAGKAALKIEQAGGSAGADIPDWMAAAEALAQVLELPDIRAKRYGGDGDTYLGQMRDGKEHGQGAMAHASGDRYEGGWNDGRKHGPGRPHRRQWHPLRRRMERRAAPRPGRNGPRQRRPLRRRMEGRHHERPGRPHHRQRQALRRRMEGRPRTRPRDRDLPGRQPLRRRVARGQAARSGDRDRGRRQTHRGRVGGRQAGRGGREGTAGGAEEDADDDQPLSRCRDGLAPLSLSPFHADRLSRRSRAKRARQAQLQKSGDRRSVAERNSAPTPGHREGPRQARR